MGSLGNYIGSNLGGLQMLLVARVTQLKVPFEAAWFNGANLVSEIELKAGNEWGYIGFAQNKGILEEVQKIDAIGVKYQYAVKCDVPARSPEVVDWLMPYLNRDLILIAIDNNNMAAVLGGNYTPVKIGFSSNTSQAAADKNGYSFTFSGESLVLAKFYGAVQAPDLPTRKVFSNGFDFGYLRTW